MPQRTQTAQHSSKERRRHKQRESPFISSCKILCCSASSTQNSQSVPQVRAGLLWLMDSLTRCWESSQPCRTHRDGSYTHHCAGGFTVRWPRNHSQFSLLCNLGCLLSSVCGMAALKGISISHFSSVYLFLDSSRVTSHDWQFQIRSYSSLFCTGAGMSSISSSPFKSPFFLFAVINRKLKQGWVGLLCLDCLISITSYGSKN